MENDINSIIKVIIPTQIKLLNKCAVKFEKNVSLQNLPRPIGNRSGVKINKLDK